MLSVEAAFRKIVYGIQPEVQALRLNNAEHAFKLLHARAEIGEEIGAVRQQLRPVAEGAIVVPYCAVEDAGLHKVLEQEQ